MTNEYEILITTNGTDSMWFRTDADSADAALDQLTTSLGHDKFAVLKLAINGVITQVSQTWEQVSH